MVYSEYFAFHENPFGETPNVRFFFRSHTHLSALHKLLWIVQQGKGFATLTGEVGTGKTLLARTFLSLIEPATNTALILHPMMHGRDLLQAIADEFGVVTPPEENPEIKTLIDRLYAHFLQSARQHRRCVLVIDEAQRLSFEALETIRLLNNLETEKEKLLQIVLVGQPELNQKLGTFQMRQLKQRLSAAAVLEPLSESETEKYIRHRIESAGGDNFVRFDAKVIRLIYVETRGVPRMINFFCEQILSAAESKEVRYIDVRFARSALHDRLSNRWKYKLKNWLMEKLG